MVEYADVVAPTISSMSPTANSRKTMALLAFSVMLITSLTCWLLCVPALSKSAWLASLPSEQTLDLVKEGG